MTPPICDAIGSCSPLAGRQPTTDGLAVLSDAFGKRLERLTPRSAKRDSRTCLNKFSDRAYALGSKTLTSDVPPGIHCCRTASGNFLVSG